MNGREMMSLEESQVEESHTLILQELAMQINKLGSSRIACHIGVFALQHEYLYEITLISEAANSFRTVDFDFALKYLTGAVDVLMALEEV